MSEHQLHIYTSRSAIETRQKCMRERYLGYHAPLIEGGERTGIVRSGSKYEARFGQVLHKHMALVLMQKECTDTIVLAAREEVVELIHECFPDLEPEIQEYTATEQAALIESLMRHWCELHLAKLLADYEVLSVEVEQDVVFKPEDYLPPAVAQVCLPLKLGFRADAVLKRKSDGAIIILDFKTAKYASEDWAINLDGSLQSNLYIAAAEHHLGQYVSGIMYAGMVKGKREMDAAKSSPYTGRVIQYGSYLYGWKDASGKVHKDYVKGRMRQYMGYKPMQELRDMGYPMQGFFPVTIPWKPIGIQQVVAQQIVAENNYTAKLATIADPQNPFGTEAAFILMEQSFGSCFKYGLKYACQFKAICHDGMHPAEVGNHFESRIDHHGEEA